jgi:hypothetical protein
VQTPTEQNAVLQSDAALHPSPVLHVPQVPPPQSTPVSAPFLTPSLHAAGWHVPSLQTPLVQSPPNVHVCESPQVGQEPPQSVAVSEPFSTSSLQAGAWQTEF